MATSKIDILNKEFTRSLRGYSCVEVDLFMQEMAHTIGALSEDRNAARQRLAALEAELKDHREREATLRDTLVNTNRMVEEMKVSAKRESRILVEAAASKADELVSSAQTRADSILSAAESKAESLVAGAESRAESLISGAESRAESLTVQAQAKADEVVEIAQTKAERALDSAEAKAGEMIAQAEARVARAHEELNEIRRMRSQFEIRLKAVIDSHVKLLDLAARELEEQDAAETPANVSYLPKARTEGEGF